MLKRKWKWKYVCTIRKRKVKLSSEGRQLAMLLLILRFLFVICFLTLNKSFIERDFFNCMCFSKKAFFKKRTDTLTRLICSIWETEPFPLRYGYRPFFLLVKICPSQQYDTAPPAGTQPPSPYPINVTGNPIFCLRNNWQISAWTAKAGRQPHAESKVSLMCFGIQGCNHTFTYAMTYICMSDHTLSWFIKTRHLPVLGGRSGERGPEGGVFWQLRDELPPRIRLIWPEH